MAALQAASVSSAAASETAGVIPVKWNQSAPSKISSKSKSEMLAVAIDELALSYVTFEGLIDAPVSRK